jgi:UDP-GlcNAc:undecaprenyl-phosphate GlcNAc-1-phosphate transferase
MDELWVPYLCVFGSALITAFATTPLAKRIAVSLGAIDEPSKRRINDKPTPRMGGVAVLLGLIVAAIVQYVGTSVWGWPVVFTSSVHEGLNYRLLAASFLVVFATGAIDDVVQLKPIPELIGQTLAAVLAVSGGLVIGHIVNPMGPGETELGIFGYPITVIYLVAFSNIINLIDGLDGLASGIACISSATMAVLATMAGCLDAAALAVALCGATLGFLPHNFHPASIFLGDCGALTLGFALGTISLLNVRRMAGLTTILIPLVIAAVPIIDTFSAIVRRKRAHVSVGHADKGHLHHRLILQQGYDQRQAVLFIYGWTVLLCVGAIAMTQVPVVPRVLIFLVLMVGSFAIARHLRLFEPVLRHHYNPDTDRDEIVAYGDPEFQVEEEREEARREERREELVEKRSLKG